MGDHPQVECPIAGRPVGAGGMMRLFRFGILMVSALPASFALGQPSPPTGKVMNASRSNQSPVAACAACHEQAKSQPGTSMARSLETVELGRILSARPLLTFKTGQYSYRIERKGNQSIYSVSDGTQTLTMPIRWAMGASSAFGQTYILEKDGELYESRVSYFSKLNGLDMTLGAQGVRPTDLLDAAGRRMSREDDRQCFGCHATNATQGKEVTLDKMTPGVQCERCHGPVDKHLASMTQPGSEPVLMKDLSKMSTEEVSTFCGQCHRTWEDVVTMGRLDINDVRFQPYRLTTSMCYDDDPRISCLACHDPHHEVVKSSPDYDAKCQACHAGGKPGAKACRVAKDRCASCHMPKIELPGSHHEFTDHRIRIVKPNAPFPG